MLKRVRSGGWREPPDCITGPLIRQGCSHGTLYQGLDAALVHKRIVIWHREEDVRTDLWAFSRITNGFVCISRPLINDSLPLLIQLPRFPRAPRAGRELWLDVI